MNGAKLSAAALALITGCATVSKKEPTLMKNVRTAPVSSNARADSGVAQKDPTEHLAIQVAKAIKENPDKIILDQYSSPELAYEGHPFSYLITFHDKNENGKPDAKDMLAINVLYKTTFPNGQKMHTSIFDEGLNGLIFKENSGDSFHTDYWFDCEDCTWKYKGTIHVHAVNNNIPSVLSEKQMQSAYNLFLENAQRKLQGKTNVEFTYKIPIHSNRAGKKK